MPERTILIGYDFSASRQAEVVVQPRAESRFAPMRAELASKVTPPEVLYLTEGNDPPPASQQRFPRRANPHLVLFRYRNLIPLMFVLMLAEIGFRIVVASIHPLSEEFYVRTPPGKYGNLPLGLLSVAMLYFAYRNCKKAVPWENGSSITDTHSRELS